MIKGAAQKKRETGGATSRTLTRARAALSRISAKKVRHRTAARPMYNPETTRQCPWRWLDGVILVCLFCTTDRYSNHLDPARPLSTLMPRLRETLGGKLRDTDCRDTHHCKYKVVCDIVMLTVLWPTVAKKSGKWYWGVVDAADRFMRWHRGEAEQSWRRHAAEDAKSGDKGRPEGQAGRGSRTATYYSCLL